MVETLPNGGVVLDRRPLPTRRGYLAAEIVLCHLPHNSGSPYATWQRNTAPGLTQGTYWGHYFETEGEARNDFAERCRKAGA